MRMTCRGFCRIRLAMLLNLKSQSVIKIRETLYALGHNIQAASKPIGGSLVILLIGMQIS